MNGSSRRLIFAAALACGLLAQEPGAPYEVSGVVYDARTSLPVQGATVMGGGPSSTSDSGGAFRSRIYRENNPATLAVMKPGYVTGIIRNVGPGMNDLRIGLKPSPEVTGQLVDSETGEPVAGIPVGLSPLGYMSSVNSLLMRPNASVRTGRDGRFALPFDPSAGSLLFIAVPPLWGQKSWILTDPFEDDRKAVDQDYELRYWPGEGNPLNIAAGSTIDTGVLRLRKANYYRANVSFPEAGCDADAKYQAALFHIEGDAYPRPIDLGPLPCGRNFSVRGLPAGSYRLEVTRQEAPAPDRRWALMDFTIVDKNVDLQAILSAGVDIQGRVVAAEGARLPRRLTVSLSEIDTSPVLHLAEVSPAASTNLRFPNVALGWKEVFVRDLPETYATEVRYRGATVPGNVFRWDGTGSLEVVVDDRGATIAGRVTAGSDSVEPVLVFVIPWPRPPIVRGGEGDFGKYDVRVDARGQFLQQGLHAGEYRVFAIPTGQGLERNLLDPAAQQRLLQRAERVTLDRGATQTITLPLLDPSR